MSSHPLPIGSERAEFLISRAGESAYERQLAQWIAERLVASGHAAAVQGSSAAHREFSATAWQVASETRLIVLISKAFLASQECLLGIAAALAGDPTNSSGRLILLRVEELPPTGILTELAFVDMVPLRHDGSLFEAGLLAAIAMPIEAAKQDAAPSALAEPAGNGAGRPASELQPAHAAPPIDPLANAIATVAIAAEAAASAAPEAKRNTSSQ